MKLMELIITLGNDKESWGWTPRYGRITNLYPAMILDTIKPSLLSLLQQ